jgi:cyclopropane-fatty-acyl-phospholipid synthase
MANTKSILVAGPAASPSAPPPILARLLERADVRFNGGRPWDIQVRDNALYQRVLRHGSLGFGESYMDGDWDSERLDETFDRVLSANVDRELHLLTRLQFLGAILKNLLINRQSRARAFEVGECHYDIGNDVYTAMLDPTMNYSCGYWKDATTLDEAQLAKLRLICEKLQLPPGEHLLDIGCGWGGLARFAAERYGVRVTGVTVSRAQETVARERCRGLPVEIALKDYREIQGRFDKVVSVGMFEHVGPKNYRDYFATVDRLLVPEGLFLLHTIGNYSTLQATDAWIDKYIFPNGRVPSARQITAAIEPTFLIEDWHNFGPDYDRTLMAWWHNFDAAWPSLSGKYDERFYRMFKYYLNGCAGYFRARQGQLWQLVLARRSRRGAYRAPR